jgi:hypothetical protein
MDQSHQIVPLYAAETFMLTFSELDLACCIALGRLVYVGTDVSV